METGYILIADVLGFSKIVTNSCDPNGQVDAWLALSLGKVQRLYLLKRAD